MPYSKTLLHAKVGLHLDRVRVVVRDEAAVPAHAVGRDSPLVHLLLGSLPRELLVLERAVLPAETPNLVARARGVEEAAPKERNS